MHKAIDDDLALERAGGNQELADELLRMLIGDLPELRDGLNRTFQANRTQDLQEIAHKINGSTRYCGVPALAAAAADLEASLKSGATTSLAAHVEHLTCEIDRLLSEATGR